MVMTQIDGGIGNQFFQYAVGRSLAIEKNSSLILDLSLLNMRAHRDFSLGQLNIDAAAIRNSRDEWTIYEKLCYSFARNKDLGRGYQENFRRFGKHTVLSGFWQSNKYFSRYDDIIRSDLYSEQIEGKLQKIGIDTSKYISVHFRRGDYLEKNYFRNLDLDYYKYAIDFARSKSGLQHLIVFSDEPQWVKAQLQIEGLLFAESFQLSAVEELFLMSKCAVNIIANSTFSWWAAYLNKRPDAIVVAPQKWVTDATRENADIIPDGRQWKVI